MLGRVFLGVTLWAVAACPRGGGQETTPGRQEPVVDEDGVLATLHPDVVVDPAGERVLVRRPEEVAVLHVGAGQLVQRVAEPSLAMWAAARYLVLERGRRDELSELLVLDAQSLQKVAACAVRAGTLATTRVEVFGLRGTAYLRTTSTGGACAVLALDVDGGACGAKRVAPSAAGLRSCEDLLLPRAAVPPSPVSGVELRIDRAVAPMASGAMEEVETLVAADLGGQVLWQREVSRRLVDSPP